MSLKPRYSLLTLLLVMAAVAASMKFVRGPHDQVVMYYSGLLGNSYPPPTPEEERLLGLTPMRGDVCSNFVIEYHLRYVNEQGRKIFSSGKGIFQAPTYLYLGHGSYLADRNPPEFAWILPRQYFPKDIKIEFVSEQKFMDQIACFVFEVNAPREHVSTGYSLSIKIPAGNSQERTPVPLYFVTTNKRIFQLEQQGLALRTVRLVTLEQIAEPALAARIAEELTAMD
jgi:hypothetical protein